MQTTEHGLPLPRYVQEDAEARGEIIGLLAGAAAKLAELTTKTAAGGFNRRTERLCTGYLTANEAVVKTLRLVEGLDVWDAETAQARGTVRAIVDIGSA